MREVGEARGGQRAGQRVGGHAVRREHAGLGHGARLLVGGGGVGPGQLGGAAVAEVDEGEGGQRHRAQQPVARERAGRAPFGHGDAADHRAAAAPQPVVETSQKQIKSFKLRCSHSFPPLQLL